MTDSASARVERTVFISYRRATGAVWALAISQALTHHGFDVFFDFKEIAGGDFEQIIVQNIKARAHFLVLLTPSALERTNQKGDWLRREIETAIEFRRNVIPVMLEGFDFSTPVIREHLTGTLEPLKAYNGLTIPVEYFEEAIDRLRTRHLNVPIDTVIHPPSARAQEAATEQQNAIKAAAAVERIELTAEQWFERGSAATDDDEAIECYTQAIKLNSDLAPAYCNRGSVFYGRGELDRALADYKESIRLDPKGYEAHFNSGNVYYDKGEFDRAVAAYDQSIRLKPSYADAHFYRGIARAKQGQYWTVRGDFSRYLSLTSDDDQDEKKWRRVASAWLKTKPPTEMAKPTNRKSRSAQSTKRTIGTSRKKGRRKKTSQRRRH